MLYFQSEVPERVAWRLGLMENKDRLKAQYNQESTTKIVLSLHERWVRSLYPTPITGRKRSGIIDPYDSFLHDVASNLGCGLSNLKNGDMKIVTQV
jgi:hypothetical protein